MSHSSGRLHGGLGFAGNGVHSLPQSNNGRGDAACLDPVWPPLAAAWSAVHNEVASYAVF